MAVLAIIGDLVGSRGSADRQALQSTLSAALADVNRRSAGLASPYTLTLGDEFQAVLGEAHRAFVDAIAIQAAVHPVLVRFSLAVDDLATPINPNQAIGMDGPAFHRARDGMEAMKADGGLFRVSAPGAAAVDLANASLALISQSFRRWHSRRFAILAALQAEVAVADIARLLDVSEQAVYKNVSDGRLRDVMAAFTAIGALLNQTLGA